MTLKELSNLQYLDALIKVAEDQLLNLEGKLTSGTHAIDGMPKQTGVKDKIGAIVPEVIIRKAKLEKLINEFEDEKKRVLDFINGVDDYLVRLVLTYRFVEYKTWAEVAEAVGGRNTEDSVKKTCYRHIKKICP